MSIEQCLLLNSLGPLLLSRTQKEINDSLALSSACCRVYDRKYPPLFPLSAQHCSSSHFFLAPGSCSPSLGSVEFGSLLVSALLGIRSLARGCVVLLGFIYPYRSRNALLLALKVIKKLMGHTTT